MSDSDNAPANLSPEHLRALWDITGTMNSSLDFDEVLNNVMDSVMQLTNAQRGFLMIADDSGELRTLIIKGGDGELLENEGYSTTIVREVVRTRQALLTNNAQFDDRYQPGQSIIMRGLRAILCAPMLVKDRLVGVVYVDTSMRAGNFSQADAELLHSVAGQAGIAIENARLYTVAVEKGRMERELQMAREIQQALLPQELPDVAGYEISPLWRAARETAGDFYDTFLLDDGHFGTVIADVSDKGAGAALFMAVARTMIRTNAFVGLSPVEIIGRTNDLILEDADSGMFVTIYHSHFYQDGRSLHVNAGHNPPLIYRHATKTVEFMPRGGRAIGWFPDNPLQLLEVQLSAGDVILYYTDGASEAENPEGEMYGEARMMQVFQRNATKSAVEILTLLNEDILRFCRGKPAVDDITMLVIRYTGT
jgi:sigma-B regulation protein RsbU (phosphoserine phosphatase)